jgi:hypothetical protein
MKLANSEPEKISFTFHAGHLPEYVQIRINCDRNYHI